MLNNKERVWIDKNKDFILLLADLQEKGFDIWEFMNLTKELRDLYTYSLEKGFDLMGLLDFLSKQISDRRNTQTADNGQSEKAA